LLDAEARIGELLPPPKSKRNDLGQLKAEKTLPQGITKQQANNFRTLADHPEVIEQVKMYEKKLGKLRKKRHFLNLSYFRNL